MQLTGLQSLSILPTGQFVPYVKGFSYLTALAIGPNQAGTQSGNRWNDADIICHDGMSLTLTGIMGVLKIGKSSKEYMMRSLRERLASFTSVKHLHLRDVHYT